MRRLLPAAALLLATLVATPALAWDHRSHGHGWRPAPAWHHPYRHPGWHRPWRPPHHGWHSGWRGHRPHAWRHAQRDRGWGYPRRW